ncbi:hypothetical protein NDU88_002657 [Pleurodeles waltl]|uniref:Uncharacterized protein n=1 Tax=Pleurodeles waltl TaxID=8319 RepID=A0AAV7M347_PLEWA|nr:hypothetical protein NDU88_002657 [Pleurodeles waltl]
MGLGLLIPLLTEEPNCCLEGKEEFGTRFACSRLNQLGHFGPPASSLTVHQLYSVSSVEGEARANESLK